MVLNMIIKYQASGTVSFSGFLSDLTYEVKRDVFNLFSLILEFLLIMTSYILCFSSLFFSKSAIS